MRDLMTPNAGFGVCPVDHIEDTEGGAAVFLVGFEASCGKPCSGRVRLRIIAALQGPV